jgi:hypothetical protein
MGSRETALVRAELDTMDGARRCAGALQMPPAPMDLAEAETLARASHAGRVATALQAELDRVRADLAAMRADRDALADALEDVDQTITAPVAVREPEAGQVCELVNRALLEHYRRRAAMGDQLTPGTKENAMDRNDTVGRAARFAAAYAALLPAHDLADHVVQTDHQAAHKAGPGWAGARAMAGHVGGYLVVQLLAVLALRVLGVRPSWRRTAAAVTLSAGTHALLDRRWPVRWILEHTGSRGFARPVVIATGEIQGDDPMEIGALHVTGQLPIHGPYLTDQALHHVVLAVCAAILAGGR